MRPRSPAWEAGADDRTTQPTPQYRGRLSRFTAVRCRSRAVLSLTGRRDRIRLASRRATVIVEKATETLSRYP